MRDRFKSLADRQLFWKTLFEEKKIAKQLPVLATDHVDGVTYDDLPQYGQVHIVVQSASNPGDNFMSDTFIVTAQLTRHDDFGNETKNTLSAFIKVLPTNSMLRVIAYEARTHHREMDVYQNFFGLLREMHPGQPIPLDVPDVYYSHMEEMVQGGADGSGTCTLLEDLKAEGYLMADKVEGADYRHCQIALTSLAHYHALTLSAVRKWTDPLTGELSKIPTAAKPITDGNKMHDTSLFQMMKDNIQSLIEFGKDVERPDLVEWIAGFVERLPEIVQIDTVESCGPLACILHGDYWNNNMLFKYADDGKTPIALKMIDFQVVRIGHPLSDVLYFLYISAKPEIRVRYMTDLLRHYYDTLTADLRLLGISLNNYTWEDFLADFKKRSLMWMFMGIIVLSFVLNKKVLDRLDEMDAAERQKEPKVADGEIVKGASGMSVEAEELMKTTMLSKKLSDNEILTDRLIKLIDEVKALHDS